jgi:glutamate-5-semialdehyde dehydrogenase
MKRWNKKQNFGGKKMNLQEMCQNAVTAKYLLQKATTVQKNNALLQAADMLVKKESYLLEANAKDIAAGKSAGMHPGLLDRLALNPARIQGMADGLAQIASLPDCVDELLETIHRPNGLTIEKRRVPLGVIGIIYESRPNVTADAFGLCFKSGNAVILKGGSDAIHSNIAIAEVLRSAVAEAGITPDAIQLITDTDRAVTRQLMQMKEYVDVLIPRGGAGLIKSVVENSTIPVIETGTGNCHIYVDKAADLDMAINIIYNAKTQRIGVCNACESLVIHEAIRKDLLPPLAAKLREKSVEIRGDERTREILPDATPATEDDYATEYLDYIISIKTIDSLEEAIRHINRYNTKHSDAIITSDTAAADRFLREVDAACVYANASTRFTDGFEFGFGAEIGISTQKLHARGPMGLKELTSYKYCIKGNGQVRG